MRVSEESMRVYLRLCLAEGAYEHEHSGSRCICLQESLHKMWEIENDELAECRAASAGRHPAGRLVLQVRASGVRLPDALPALWRGAGAQTARTRTQGA